MITKATKKQWKEIEALKEKWIEDTTKQYSFTDVETVVHDMYKSMDMKPPLVILAPSPYSMVVYSALVSNALNSLHKNKDSLMEDIKTVIKATQRATRTLLSNSIVDQTNYDARRDMNKHLADPLSESFHNQLYSQIIEQLDADSQLVSQLRSHLDSQLRSHLYGQLVSHLYGQLVSQHSSQLDSQLRSQLVSQLRSQLRSQLQSQLKSQLDSHIYSQLDSQLDMEISNKLTCLGDNFIHQIYTQLSHQIERRLGDKLGNQFSEGMNRQIEESLNQIITQEPYSAMVSADISEIMERLNKEVGLQLATDTYLRLRKSVFLLIYMQISNCICNQLEDELESDLQKSIKRQPRCVGVFWRAWSGWYAGAKILGVKFDEDKLDLFTRWNDIANTWCAHNGLCVVSQNPIECHWLDGELHNESGPSVLWSDGYALWTIRGVTVDEQIVMRPETQTIEQIREEENEEVKRIRIERYGWEKFIKEVEAKVIDRRTNDVDGTREALFSLPDGIRTFVGRCRSTGRVYFLEVGPEVETCEGAQVWLRGGRKGNCIGAS